jgi:hypothetical protein
VFAFDRDIHGKNIPLTRPIATGYKLPANDWEFINHPDESRQQNIFGRPE